MNLFKTILIPFLVLFISFYGYGQDCKDFHKSKDCYVYVPLDRDFQVYNQAKSVLVDVGKPSIFKVVLYGKKDFIVDKSVSGSLTEFRKRFYTITKIMILLNPLGLRLKIPSHSI